MTLQSKIALPRRESNEADRVFSRLIHERWSPRAFSDTDISREEIFKIFDAGRHVASSFNAQPWRFILASRDDEHYMKLFECLNEGNAKWVGNAPYLAVAVSDSEFKNRDKKNRHCFYDTGAFMAVASIAALIRDIYIHQMAGFSPEKVKENFDMPDRFEPITMFALGHLGDPEELPEDLEKKEDPHSDRNGVHEFLFGPQWGKPYLNRKG